MYNNKNMSLEIIKEKITVMGLNGFLGLIGAGAKYVYYVLTGKEPKFSFVRLGLNMFLGVVIGVMIGEFIPKEWLVRDGLVILSGIGSFELIKKIEKDGMLGTIDEILLIFKKK